MKKLWVVLAGLLIAGGAMAQTKPFNASLTPDYSVYGRNVMIEGATLSIWGENPQTSLAIGFVNGTVGQSAGLSLGLLNYAQSYKGLQWSLVNYTTGDVSGWQGGFVFGIAISALNYTGGNMRGLQTGVVNYAGKLTGLQIGVLNYAETAKSGVQIGLVNLIPDNRWFNGLPNELAPGMIFVNWRF
jgi:hypothetical protein